jgi:serine-type D-Ala-D-Ala carboxypeptidase (penicillin-binding protein 5/6)
MVITAGCAGSAGAAPRSTASNKDEMIQIGASNAILIDAETSNVLFEKNSDQLIAPAGLASLMTAEVIFHELSEGRLKLDDQFEISEHAWRQGGAPSHTISMFAPIHSKVRVEDLLRGAIVQSANDACIALAEGLAGSETNFAQKMNERAHEIGLIKSTFTNSTGFADQV